MSLILLVFLLLYVVACENSRFTSGGFQTPREPPDVRRLFSQAMYVADLSVYSGALRCENELVARSKRLQNGKI